ncbi:hypothetical protein AK812_SmicGene5269 [Symbiodinium microadriaticum]|uniref:Uncharacterized protein n=1 Tax=Symbiodinium microadriaticum TaxID=2951 RepID=A0A1Q9EU69_SYMMI|nr:hypothetical protein AK812_SmicGene5269 [Symbiodinium microadriaticum]
MPRLHALERLHKQRLQSSVVTWNAAITAARRQWPGFLALVDGKQTDRPLYWLVLSREWRPSFSPTVVYSNHVDASRAPTLLSVLFVILLTS